MPGTFSHILAETNSKFFGQCQAFLDRHFNGAEFRGTWPWVRRKHPRVGQPLSVESWTESP